MSWIEVGLREGKEVEWLIFRFFKRFDECKPDGQLTREMLGERSSLPVEFYSPIQEKLRHPNIRPSSFSFSNQMVFQLLGQMAARRESQI